MRILFPLIISCFFVLFLGCKDNESVESTEKQFAPTHDGHLIKFHKDVPGPTTQVGDLVHYHVRHRNGNTVTFTSRAGSKEPFKYLVSGVNPNVKIPPILIGLLQMSPGDSLTLRYDLKENRFKEPGYENAKFKDFDISLIKIEKGIDQIVFNTRQRVIEPKEFNQEIDYNSSTQNVTGGETKHTADGLWEGMMEKVKRTTLRVR